MRIKINLRELRCRQTNRSHNTFQLCCKALKKKKYIYHIAKYFKQLLFKFLDQEMNKVYRETLISLFVRKISHIKALKIFKNLKIKYCTKQFLIKFLYLFRNLEASGKSILAKYWINQYVTIYALNISNIFCQNLSNILYTLQYDL